MDSVAIFVAESKVTTTRSSDDDDDDDEKVDRPRGHGADRLEPRKTRAARAAGTKRNILILRMRVNSLCLLPLLLQLLSPSLISHIQQDAKDRKKKEETKSSAVLKRKIFSFVWFCDTPRLDPRKHTMLLFIMIRCSVLFY